MERNPDIELVLRLREGAYSAFDALYDKYSALLYGFAFSLTRSADLAGSIVQDSFITIWLKRSNLDPERPFKPYLFAIAKNRMIDEFRKRLSEPLFEDYVAYSEEQFLQHSPEVDRMIDYDAFVKALRTAKDKLSPRQREIFCMSKEEGMASSEIATRLGVSEQTVYNQLSTALKRLREEIPESLVMLFVLFFLS